MQKIINNKTLIKQLKRFLLSGGLAVATDFATYFIFLQFLSPSPAKAIAFICGAIVAFFMNKYFTFEKKEKSVKEGYKFASLYFITFWVNVLSNKFVLFLFPSYTLLAFLIATAITMTCNFIGQKFLVFKV